MLAAAAAALSSPAGAATRSQGGLIAYTIGNGDEEPASIMAIRSDGTGTRRLLGPTQRYAGGAASPVWSRDGRRLLFQRFRKLDWSQPSTLWTADADGHDARPVPHVGDIYPNGFDWSPDGRRIVYSAGGGGPHIPVIYTIGVTGGHRHAVRRGYAPTWSGDGRHIAYLRPFGRDRYGSVLVRVAIMRPDGSGLRELTSGPFEAQPTFSPDGRRLTYVRAVTPPDEEWRVVGADGENDTLIRRFGTEDIDAGISYGALSWTPDGRRLAAIRTSRSLTGHESSTAELITMRLSGTGVRALFTFPVPYVGDFSWQPVPARP